MKNNRIEKIQCAIFQSKNKIIEKFTKAINQAHRGEKKAELAGRLVQEAEDLLSCARFSEARDECRICRSIAKLREQTANLIIKLNQ